MRSSFALSILVCFLFCATSAFSQKETPRQKSGKNLRNTLIFLLKDSHIIKDKKKPPCDVNKLIKSLKRADLVPTKAEATKIIDRLMDSLELERRGDVTKRREESFELALKETAMTKFAAAVSGENYGDLSSREQKRIREYYYRIKILRTDGYQVFEKNITSGECKINVKTTIKAPKWKLGYKKKKFGIFTVDWEFFTRLNIDCKCTAKNLHKVKKTIYEFTGKSQGPLLFDPYDYLTSTAKVEKIIKYGLRFEKLQNPVGGRVQLNCCTEEDEKSEDGSFVDPNEPIRYDSPFINTGIGLGFVNDADTQITGNAGVLFPVASIGDNPLFLGGQFGINSSSISSDFATNEYRIGPIAEYDVNINDRGLEWVVGLFTGYIFGNSDLGEFDQDFDGFFANLYTGLDIPISESITIPVILSFMEYQSLNLTIDATGEEGSFDSGISFDRIGLSTGVRINISN